MQGDPSTIEVLDALATPVLQVAADGRIRHANEAAGRWLRVGRKRLVGLPLAALERDGQAVTAALAEAVLGPLCRRETLQAAARAGSAREALTLVLTSPEFHRR